MALLSLVGWQTQRLDMVQVFNPLSGSARFRELENVLTLTIPTLTTPGPAAGR